MRPISCAWCCVVVVVVVVTVSVQQVQPLTAQVVVGCSMPEVGLALDNENGQLANEWMDEWPVKIACG